MKFYVGCFGKLKYPAWFFGSFYSVIVIRFLHGKFNNLCKELSNGRPQYERCQEAALKARLHAKRLGFR